MDKEREENDGQESVPHRKRDLNTMIHRDLRRIVPQRMEHINHDLHRLVPHQLVILLRERRRRDFAVPFPFVAFRRYDVTAEKLQDFVLVDWLREAGTRDRNILRCKTSLSKSGGKKVEME